MFALEPPSLINPPNNSTISSLPTFSWQAVSGSAGYNILIDDESSFTSPYAKTPYYPTNPSYSPQTLNPGTYYWKVKAKDSNGNWGSFSSIWSFTLASSIPSPIPDSSLTSTPSPTPTPSSSVSASSFTLSSTPSSINSDQSFSINISLVLPNNPNTKFYLKGAFRKSDSSNYFGLTKVRSDWIKNSSTYSNQYKITTDSFGNWSGTLEVKPDSEDSGFVGSGDYIFKVGRYKESDNPSVVWSNESNINIIAATQSTQTTTSTPKPSSTTNPSNNSSTNSKSTPTKTASQPKFNSTASIAGASISATPSATPITSAAVKSQKQFKPLLWLGVIFIIIGFGSLGFIILKSFLRR